MNSLFDRTPYQDETLYGLHDLGYCTALYRLHRHLSLQGI
jgi:hypothetical protein